MIKMVQATRRTLNPRFGSLVGRSKLAFVFGFLATAIVFLAVFSWFQRNQFDDARSAEVNLNQIATLTREINNLTWTALQEQNLTPEADAGMRAARQALRKAELAAHLHAHHTSALEGVWPVLDNYIMSAGGQWILIQIGDFDKAKQADFQVGTPHFDLMQHQLQIAIEAEDKRAQGVALRGRNALVAAAILAATYIP